MGRPAHALLITFVTLRIIKGGKYVEDFLILSSAAKQYKYIRYSITNNERPLQLNTVIYNPKQASRTTTSLKCNNNESTVKLMPL